MTHDDAGPSVASAGSHNEDSLRDLFAAAALAGLIARVPNEKLVPADELCPIAFNWAEEMLAAKASAGKGYVEHTAEKPNEDPRRPVAWAVRLHNPPVGQNPFLFWNAEEAESLAKALPGAMLIPLYL